MDLPVNWAGSASATKQSWPDMYWWQHFGNDELTSLVLEGQHNNYEIAAAVARVRQAQIQAKIAGSSLFPSIELVGGAARQLATPTQSSITSTSGGVAIGYEVDFWGRNQAGLSAAEASLRANVYDRETINLTVTCSIVSTYLEVLSLRDRLVIAKTNVSNSERILALLQAQHNAGAAMPLDIARQRSVVASMKGVIPDLEQQEHDAQTVLAILLGHTPQNFSVKGKGLSDVLTPEITPGMPSELLSRRPDIQHIEAQLASANANIAVARAALFPSIYLTGSTGAQSNALAALFNSSNFLTNFGGSLVAPIFDAGNLRGARDLAIEQKQELVQIYHSTVINALSEVEKALSLIHSLEERSKLKDIEVEQAHYAYDQAESRYRAGAEYLSNVIDAQRSLSDAEDQLGQIKLSRLQATVSLYKALGGGWQDDMQTRQKK